MKRSKNLSVWIFRVTLFLTIYNVIDCSDVESDGASYIPWKAGNLRRNLQSPMEVQTSINMNTPPIESTSLKIEEEGVTTAIEPVVAAVQENPPANSINILTLGGSVTWGARLSDRFQAYPKVLEQISEGKYKVTNKAMRATDAYYPSLCIQSILSDTNDQDFSVIILEYSINGPNGLDTLVKRLQYRFPDAIFIYVHVYALSSVIVDNSGKLANEYPHVERGSIQFHWDPDPQKAAVRPSIMDFFTQIRGHVYSLPKPRISPYDAMQYFAVDWVHLSELGHRMVAHDLLNLLSHAQYDKPSEIVPSLFESKWGYGDSCENWFETGELTLSYDRGEVKSLYTREAYNQNKFALEFYYDDYIVENGGTIGVINEHATQVPLFLTYLSAPKKYPITTIVVNGRITEIDPDRDAYHVAVTKQVGFAQPGINNVLIKPQYKTDEPFRLVGTALYGFYNNRDMPLLRTHNYIPTREGQIPEDEINHKPLHLLSLGGPVTWGSRLQYNELSYPSRIGQLTNNHITNMGIRATDAFYPSLCIQSMLGADDTEYDVILLEYSNTNPTQHLVTDEEIKGLRMLVKRLQYRYPNAILIYVHLYSLRHVIKDVHGNLADAHDEPPKDFQWSWAYTHKEIYRAPRDVQSLMKLVGGYIYKLPVPETPMQAFELFSGPTYDALSAKGHRIVGDAIASILVENARLSDMIIQNNGESIDGSWGYGDQCLSWLGMGGTIPVEYGGEGVEKRDMGNFEWSLEFSSSFLPMVTEDGKDETAVDHDIASSGGWIRVVNDKEVATPVFFTYILGGTLGSTTTISVNDVTTVLKYDLDEEGRDFKYQTKDIGWVGPGTTIVNIEPQQGCVLQLIGISLFGFYQHKDLPLKSMHNTIQQGEDSDRGK